MTDNAFAELLVIYLTTPSTDFYLSKLLGNASNPRLEPLTIPYIDLGKKTIMGESLRFELKNLVVNGLSNVEVSKNNDVPKVIVNGNLVDFSAQLPNKEAPPAGISSSLTISAQLVITDDSPMYGTITIVINSSALTGTFKATSSDGSVQKCEVVFSKFNVSADTGAGNFKITVNLNDPLSGFISAVLNQPGLVSQMVGSVNAQINQPPILKSLSDYATTAARTSLNMNAV
jgi:hypothetical protein